jgi:hypothetical protein
MRPTADARVVIYSQRSGAAGEPGRQAANVKAMLKRHPFLIGFAGSMLFFVAVNLWAYAGAVSGRGVHGIIVAGFPLRWYVTGYGSGVIWDALATDVSIALTASLIAGIVIKPIFRPDR